MEVLPETYYDAKQKIWSGPKRKFFFGPEITVGEVVLYVLSKNPNKVIEIMESTGEQLAAAEIIRNGKIIARNFEQMGLQIGDVIGLFVNNSIHLSSIVLGGLLCGTPFHATFPNFDADTVKLIYGATRPKMIICEMANHKIAKKVCQELQLGAKIYVIDGNINGLRNVKELFTESENMKNGIGFVDTFPCLKLTGKDTALIFGSSGTTGPPKGMMSTHETLINSQEFLSAVSDSVVFSYSTLHWITGWFAMLTSLKVGCQRLITNQPFCAKHFVECIEKYKVPHFITAPNFIAEVLELKDSSLRTRLSSLKTLACGGAKVPRAISEKMCEILNDKSKPGFTVAYGLSEISTGLTRNMINLGGGLDCGEGKLVANFKVKIMSENWEPMGPNETGMICILPPFKWPGYYRNPEATKKTMYGDWIITGDVGYFDDENNLHICSRNGDVFKRNGLQVYPERIEEIVMRIPGVLEACVFGVPVENLGHFAGCAIVRSKNNHGEKLTSDIVANHVKENIAEFCHLTGGVYFMDSLPRTPSGKPQRNKLWDILKNKAN